MDLDALLHDVQAGTMSIEAAKAQLKAAPYLDLGYAKLDTHRGLRTGMAEVVFCQGKADEHLLAIFEHLLNTEGAILGTRCSKEQAELIKAHIKSHELYYDPISHIISTKNPEDKSAGRGLICVVTAGTADIKVAEEAAQVCEFFDLYGRLPLRSKQPQISCFLPVYGSYDYHKELKSDCRYSAKSRFRWLFTQRWHTTVQVGVFWQQGGAHLRCRRSGPTPLTQPC